MYKNYAYVFLIFLGLFRNPVLSVKALPIKIKNRINTKF